MKYVVNLGKGIYQMRNFIVGVIRYFFKLLGKENKNILCRLVIYQYQVINQEYIRKLLRSDRQIGIELVNLYINYLLNIFMYVGIFIKIFVMFFVFC